MYGRSMGGALRIAHRTFAEEREVAAAAATQSKDQNLFEWKWIILGMEWHYGKWE